MKPVPYRPATAAACFAHFLEEAGNRQNDDITGSFSVPRIGDPDAHPLCVVVTDQPMFAAYLANLLRFASRGDITKMPSLRAKIRQQQEEGDAPPEAPSRA